MSKNSKREVLLKMRERYVGRGREGRSKLIDEVCAMCGYERTHAIKVLNEKLAHCGELMAGDFCWSVTVSDVLTQWTETRAVWNKGQHEVRESIEEIEKALAFPLLGFDCDNGGEFLNWHLRDYFLECEKPVAFTRSRPYRKNDNARVEQKNWTHVRQLAGYGRLGDPAQAEMLNDLYAKEWG